jgi:hypothetical protein
VTTEKKIADCFSKTMHAKRGLHALACSNYFRSFFFGGGVGIRDLGGRFDLQEFEHAAALLIGRLKHEEERISEKCILL